MNNSTCVESTLLKLANSTALITNGTGTPIQLDSRSWILQELSTTALILIFSLTLITIGSYSTVSKPKHAGDPREDMNSNKDFDPTDMDDSKYFITNKFDLETCVNFPHCCWFEFIRNVLLHKKKHLHQFHHHMVLYLANTGKLVLHIKYVVDHVGKKSDTLVWQGFKGSI